MKKTIITAVVFSCLFSLAVLTGCANAMVNDGNNVKKYTTTHTNANGGVAPFATYNGKMDMQSWNDSYDSGGCTVMTQDDFIVVTQAAGKSWYALAITSDKAADHSNSSNCIYDLSEIAKVTFEAKADRTGSKINFSLCTENKVAYDITEEFQTFTYDATQTTHTHSGLHHCLVLFVHDTLPEVTHYIKNVTFYDAAGNEILPVVTE